MDETDQTTVEDNELTEDTDVESTDTDSQSEPVEAVAETEDTGITPLILDVANPATYEEALEQAQFLGRSTSSQRQGTRSRHAAASPRQ